MAPTSRWHNVVVQLMLWAMTQQQQCTVLKAAGLLSCLWMKIISFGMKLKMNVTFERGSAQDPLVQSSLHWDERCFYVKNRRASCMECYSLGNDFTTTIARVVPSRTKRLLDGIGRVKCAAVVPHRRLVLDAILRDLLHCLWRVGLAATSPTRREAHLLWMSHKSVSPAWGYSVQL